MSERSGSTLPSGSQVVLLPAEIDAANAHQVLFLLTSALDRGGLTVIADMSRTTFCDCAGVGALQVARRLAELTRTELRIVASTRSVLRIFQLTELPLLMRIYPNLAAADAGPTSAGP